jgi:hypothetical protein
MSTAMKLVVRKLGNSAMPNAVVHVHGRLGSIFKLLKFQKADEPDEAVDQKIRLN